MICPGREVARRPRYQNVDAAERGVASLERGPHRLGIAHIGARPLGARARRANVLDGDRDFVRIARDHEDRGAGLAECGRNSQIDAADPARDENGFSFEIEHANAPLCCGRPLPSLRGDGAYHVKRNNSRTWALRL